MGNRSTLSAHEANEDELPNEKTKNEIFEKKLRKNWETVRKFPYKSLDNGKSFNCINFELTSVNPCVERRVNSRELFRNLYGDDYNVENVEQPICKRICCLEVIREFPIPKKWVEMSDYKIEDRIDVLIEGNSNLQKMNETIGDERDDYVSCEGIVYAFNADNQVFFMDLKSGRNYEMGYFENVGVMKEFKINNSEILSFQFEKAILKHFPKSRILINRFDKCLQIWDLEKVTFFRIYEDRLDLGWFDNGAVIESLIPLNDEEEEERGKIIIRIALTNKEGILLMNIFRRGRYEIVRSIKLQIKWQGQCIRSIANFEKSGLIGTATSYNNTNNNLVIYDAQFYKVSKNDYKLVYDWECCPGLNHNSHIHIFEYIFNEKLKREGYIIGFYGMMFYIDLQTGLRIYRFDGSLGRGNIYNYKFMIQIGHNEIKLVNLQGKQRKFFTYVNKFDQKSITNRYFHLKFLSNNRFIVCSERYNTKESNHLQPSIIIFEIHQHIDKLGLRYQYDWEKDYYSKILNKKLSVDEFERIQFLWNEYFMNQEGKKIDQNIMLIHLKILQSKIDLVFMKFVIEQ